MCNRVVLKTGDTIFEDGICYDACVFNGIKCKILEDGRGKRAKFWIITPTKDKYLLKYNDNDVNTLENAGQFIMDGIFDQLSQNHAKYLVVDFEKDGVKYDAILSKNFKLNDFRELSGFTINNKLANYLYDNENGYNINFHHTVDYYCKVFQLLYSKNPIDLSGIRFELLKYCLLQYVFAMSDLHYYNLSFMFDEKLGHKSLSVTPFYDCGNICGLNLSQAKVKSNYENFLKTGKIDFLLERKLLEDKMPLFGLKSEMSKFQVSQSGKILCRPLGENFSGEQKIEFNKNIIKTLRDELAVEIVRNEQLHNFYQKIKNIDFDKILNDYNQIKEGTIPLYCMEVVKLYYTSAIKKLDKRIKYVQSLKEKYGSFLKGEESKDASFVF